MSRRNTYSKRKKQSNKRKKSKSRNGTHNQVLETLNRVPWGALALGVKMIWTIISSILHNGHIQ